MKPSEVVKTEAAKGWKAYCGMLGCAEKESLARRVVKWLASSGDRWNIPLALDEIGGTAWEWKHFHPDGGDCLFKVFLHLDPATHRVYVGPHLRRCLQRRVNNNDWDQFWRQHA